MLERKDDQQSTSTQRTKLCGNTIKGCFAHVQASDDRDRPMMMSAVAALAITSLAQSNERVAAKSNSIQIAQSTPTMPMSLPLDSGEVGPFAFGYLVFENDPAGGVPGFGPLPSRSPAQ